MDTYSGEVIERDLAIETQREISSLSDQAKELVKIESDADLEWAGQFQTTLKEKRKEIEAFFKSEIEAAHMLHKRLCGKLKRFTDPIDAALAITSPGIGAYIKTRQAQEKMEQEKAAKVADKKGLPPPPPTTAPFVAPKGITATTRWEAEIVDMMALVKAVAAKKVPIVAVEPNTKFLNQQATSLKELLDFPGVKVKELTGTMTRTGGSK